MQSLDEIAVAAIQAKDDNSLLYGEFLRELEAMGCSSAKIAKLLKRARAAAPNPQAPRALRILKRAARAAAKGDEERSTRLRAIACDLVGEDEVEALSEEHRLSFVVQRFTPEAERPVRCGFAIV